MQPDWQTDDGAVRLYCGDSLEVLADMPESSIDGFVTDPPYSSGGAFRGDRMAKTVAKYVQSGAIETCRDEFSGDNRDQRAFLAWCSLWMMRCHDLTVPGGVMVSFIDWRQLPVLTDAIQCGGWVWRGLGTWWKPGIRMQKGRFSGSAEYVVYASRGIPNDGQFSPQNVFQCQPVPGDEKTHVAEKPVDVMRWAASVVRPSGIICDPFMGSAASASAALALGLRYIGIEKDRSTFDVAVDRVVNDINRLRLFEPAAKVTQKTMFGGDA